MLMRMIAATRSAESATIRSRRSICWRDLDRRRIARCGPVSLVRPPSSVVSQALLCCWRCLPAIWLACGCGKGREAAGEAGGAVSRIDSWAAAWGWRGVFGRGGTAGAAAVDWAAGGAGASGSDWPQRDVVQPDALGAGG